ncbi:MAG: hypothetical protein V3S62_07895 [Acidimicrobiia bacterium]
MKLVRKLRTRLAGDDGFALAITMSLGAIVFLLSTVMMTRGVRQVMTTALDIRWDRALDSAEAGLDFGIQILEADGEYSTGDVPPAFATPKAEREWAVLTALGKPASEVVVTPTGEFVVVKPPGTALLYSVGFSPTRDAAVRSERAVRIGYTLSPIEWEVEFALLVGGDLSLSGNTTINDTNDNFGASVHVNGELSTTGGSYVVDGCVTSSVTALTGAINCPPSPIAPRPIPTIDPLLMYPFAHFVLCDDGVPYGGPAHPVNPDPDGVPCTGDETAVPLSGWSSKKLGNVWNWKTTTSSPTEGVFYIHHGDFNGNVGADNSPATEITLILSSISDGACTGKSTGNMRIGAASNMVVHPSLAALGYDLAIIAQGDVDFGGGATVGGLILAHEQIDYAGSSDSWGAVVAAGVCNTVGSPVSSSGTTGTSFINFAGPINTPFTDLERRADVVAWHEL